MTFMDTDALAVITGPIRRHQGLLRGEVVRVIQASVAAPTVAPEFWVFGFESHRYGYVRATSLTPLADISEDTPIDWEREDEEYARLNGTHDYVHEEDE